MNKITRFLNLKEPSNAIGRECVKAMVELQLSLKSKESKLAGYRRINWKCSMDACTTSPAESTNNLVKHSLPKMNSLFDLLFTYI